MSSQGDATLPATRRSRKSIGVGPAAGKLGEKENSTLDVGSAMNGSRKKTRSKSMGPGGLDILKMGNGNRRASLAVPSVPPPRSILKPTLPLPEIPTFKPKEPTSSNESAGTKVALRTEEEQQAAAREREERERAQLEKDIKDRREARRKSLANRRVSFAAEATLHTFHEVDENQDATNSTNSTGRGAPPPQQHYDAPESDPPSTPPELESMYGEDDTITSTVYDSDMEHGDDVAEVEGDEMTGSSDSDEDGTIMTVEAEEMTSASVASMTSARSGFGDNDSTSSGSLDENLRLAQQRAAATQRIDEDEEIIAGFGGWGKKQQSRAQESATQIIQSMAPSHATTARDQDQGADVEMDMDMDEDMDMTKAVGGILRSQPVPSNSGEDVDMEMDMDEDIDMSMDVTKAIGGIISKPKPQTRRKSVKPSSRLGTEDDSEQTMEFTTAVGAIQTSRMSNVSLADVDENEDMSMEFTTAIGGFLSKTISKNTARTNRRRTVVAEENDGMEMDMTVGVGRILPTAQVEQEEGDFDQTMGMDMTTAVGGILRSVTPEARSAARRVMEEEADHPDPSITTSAEITASPKRQTPTSDDNPTLGLSGFQGQGLRRSLPSARRGSRSPERMEIDSSPLKSSPIKSSPLKSSPVKSSPVKNSPARSSPVRNSPVRITRASPARRTPSPARNLPQGPQAPSSLVGSSSPVRATASPPKTTPRSVTKGKLFHQDPSTGVNTPRVVLTPQGRRLSGVGADRSGLGSPRVAEILDRRESLADSATKFVPSQLANPRRTVAFSDPRVMEAEVDKELEEEHEKENNRSILEREVNESQEDRDITLNLKEMIQNLSPKKNPLRGRKSLHVGSARGLLGKRPAFESDEEEDSEEPDGLKRLKGHQGSPVKNIRLKSPPSKAETTTGRKTRSSTRLADDNDTSTPVVHSSPQRATTPRNGRFKAVDDQPAPVPDFEHTTTLDEAEMQRGDDDGDRITLQDFLNLTSIRFMELNTTKRRHTVAPGESARLSLTSDGKEDLSLENCVVAGACTVPQLEMYQHACRELKKYISEGRSIVREIENEVFEENPPLFREYMTATPEFKALMDNQFKDIKSYARLLSKAMWYEWRMKLQKGLLDGLLKISEGMDDDEKHLCKEEEQLAAVLPGLVKHHETLQKQCAALKEAEHELATVDPAELEAARAELSALDSSIAEKSKNIAELRRQAEEYDESIETMTKQKQQYLDEIKEADKVRKECRGWTSEEVGKLKTQTDKIEKKSGWAVTGISGTTISMSYHRQIELVFDTAAFQQRKGQPQTNPNAPVDLWYIADKHPEPNQAVPSTPEKEFFLEYIRDHIRALPQASTRPNRLVGIVAAGWDKAVMVAEYVRLLNLTFPTTVKRTSDASIAVVSSLLLVPLQTRVEVVLNLRVVEDNEKKGVEVEVVPEAKVVYGEQFNVGKMTEFLAGKIGGRVGGGDKVMMGWDQGVLELHKRLLPKGAKAAQK